MSELQATHSAPPEVHSLAGSRRYDQLTVDDHLLILRLAEKELPQTEIAQRLGCDQSTVSRSLQKHRRSTVDLAKGLAQSAAYKLTERAIDIAETARPEDSLRAIKVVGGIAGLITDNKGLSVQANIVIASQDDARTWGNGPVVRGESVSVDAPVMVQPAESLSKS